MAFGLIARLINATSKWFLRCESAKPLSASRRFLFLQYEKPLGAAVLATPVFEALRLKMPEAYVVVAASGISYQTLRNNPYINELIETPHPLNSFGHTCHYYLSHIRRRKKEFDCVICNKWNGRLRITLLAWLSGIPWRIGYDGSIKLLHRSLPARPGESVIANNLRLLEFFGNYTPHLERTLFYNTQDNQAIQNIIRTYNLSPKSPVIGMVTQTNGGEPNAWFADRFVELAKKLIHLHDAQLIFTGNKDDIPDVEAIRAHVGAKTHSAVGQTNISQLAALFSQCDLVITLDTGGFHVARSVRTPCVVIGNAARPALEWLPQNNPLFTIIRHDGIACANCLKSACSTRECLQAITVNDVLSAVSQLLYRLRSSEGVGS